MSTGADKVYEKNGYIILRVKNGYIVYNTKKVFSEGHTHLRSFSMAKTLIDICIKRNKWKSNNPYIITIYIILSDVYHYIMNL